jgi:hypothetical protein
MIAENDFRDLPSIIDAVFRSPLGIKPYPGRDLVCLLLSTAAGVFEDFNITANSLMVKTPRWSSGRQNLGNAMASLIGPQVKALCAAAGGLVKLSELFAFGKDTLAIYSFM